TPWEVRFEWGSPFALLREREEIQAAAQMAQQDFERICDALIAQAETARRLFEEDLERILSGVKEELVAAYLDRSQMEQVLQMAVIQEMQLKLAHLREPLL